MSTQTQNASHSLPRKVADLSNHRYCVLEYTPEQRKQIVCRPLFASLVAPSYPAQPVPGDPHAMIVFVGMTCEHASESRPEFATVHVPGVIVGNDDFVSGYHYGMCAAYDDSDEGTQPLDEAVVAENFLEVAADAIMLAEQDETPAFSAGFVFGYFNGVTQIGTAAFQQWANGASSVAV